MNLLKTKRKELNITQAQAANACNVSLRTYQGYEEKTQENDTFNELLEKLKEIGLIDGSNYIVSLKAIKNCCRMLFMKKYPEVDCAYLYGDYSLNKADGKSQIQIAIILNKPIGLKIVSIERQLKEDLHKSVIVKRIDELFEQPNQIKDILKDGIKIYSKR